MELQEVVVRLGLAFVLGMLIGVERQWRQRMAGLRTNTLVATGAALFVLLSVLTPAEASPTRMAAQVVSGIGFLGAGVIMRDGLNIRGLNTAATLWCSAAVGTLAGAGFLREAVAGAVFILIVNTLLRPVAQGMDRSPRVGREESVRYGIIIQCRREQESQVRAILLQAVGEEPIMMHSLHSEDVVENGRASVEANLLSAEGRVDTVVEKIANRLLLEDGVSSVRWKIISHVLEEVDDE